jgi:hypothetical protein
MIASPQFEFDDFFWSADVQLPSWVGFRDASLAYGGLTDKSSDGTIRLTYAPEGRDDAPLNSDELAQVRWFLDHEAAVADALLTGLLAAFPALRESYDCYKAQEMEDYMPPVSAPDGFRRLIGLNSVNIHPIMKTDMPYLGFEFGCEWDQEHGLGILMHGTRFIEVGGADTAILLWVAKRDFNAS